MKTLGRILKNPEVKIGTIFGASSVISSVIAMAVGIVMIRWIEPSELGVWQSLSILQLYIPFIEFGIPNGLNRELPYLWGKGEEERGLKLAQTAQQFMLIVSLVLFIGTVLTSIILFLLRFEAMILAGVATVGLLLSVNAYQRYLTVTYRSSQSFLSLSKLFGVQIVLQLILLPLVWMYRYYGLLAYTFLVTFGFTLAMHFGRPIKLGPQFQKEYFWQLVKTGLPVFIMGYIRGVSNSFNRLILLLKSGTLSVGLFTPVNAIATMITVLPGVLGNFFFPQMNYLLGSTQDPKKLWPIVIKINLILLVAAIPFIILIWVITPYVVSTYFEKYEYATKAMQWFSLNFIFSGSLVSHNVIYAVKAYTLGYIYVGLELILRFVLPYGILTFGSGNELTLIVYGTLVCNCTLFILNLVLIKMALARKL